MKVNNTSVTYTNGVADDNEFTRELRLDSIRSKIENRSIRDRAIFELSLITPLIEASELINLNVSDIDVEQRVVKINVNRAKYIYLINAKCSALLEQMLDSMSEEDTPLFIDEFGERLSLYRFWIIKREIWTDITLLFY